MSNFDDATVTIRDADPSSEAEGYVADQSSKLFELGSIGGIDWLGDDDREKIFGTSWIDDLRGMKGND